MSKPTGIKLADYCKALEIAAVRAGYGNLKYGPRGGSVYGFQLFERKEDAIPCVIWAVHVGHNKKKEIYSGDLKKVWEKTSIGKDLFLEILNSF